MNARKLTAEIGVKKFESTVLRSATFVPSRTASVLTTASFAEKPEMSEVTTRQVAESERTERRRYGAPYQGKQTVGAVNGDVETCVERSEKPDDDRCGENDGKGTAEKVLCLFPKQHENATRGREAVVRQLHDEGNGLTAEDGAL